MSMRNRYYCNFFVPSSCNTTVVKNEGILLYFRILSARPLTLESSAGTRKQFLDTGNLRFCSFACSRPGAVKYCTHSEKTMGFKKISSFCNFSFCSWANVTQCSLSFPTVAVEPGGSKETALIYCVKIAKDLCTGPQKRHQPLVTNFLRRFWISLQSDFAFGRQLMAFRNPSVRVVSTFVLAWPPKIVCTPRCSRYIVFCESVSFNSCPSMAIRHPNNTLQLLLIGVPDIQHLQFAYVFEFVDSCFESKDGGSWRRSTFSDFCDSYDYFWIKWCKVIDKRSFLIFRFLSKIRLYFELSVVQEFVQHSWQNSGKESIHGHNSKGRNLFPENKSLWKSTWRENWYFSTRCRYILVSIMVFKTEW